MAKHRRQPKNPLSALVRELERLDARRKILVERIRRATESLVSGEGPLAGPPAGRPPGRRKPGRRKGFKMSAAARKKMSLAAKKRWAERRKTAA